MPKLRTKRPSTKSRCKHEQIYAFVYHRVLMRWTTTYVCTCDCGGDAREERREQQVDYFTEYELDEEGEIDWGLEIGSDAEFGDIETEVEFDGCHCVCPADEGEDSEVENELIGGVGSYEMRCRDCEKVIEAGVTPIADQQAIE